MYPKFLNLTHTFIHAFNFILLITLSILLELNVVLYNIPESFTPQNMFTETFDIIYN